MKQYVLNHKIVNIFFVLFIILFSGHAFHTTQYASTYLLFLVGMIVFLLISKQFTKKALTVLDFSLIIFLLMIFLTFITEFGSNAIVYFTYICNILIAYFTVTRFSFDKTVKILLNIMTWVTAFSIIGYILVNNTNFMSMLPSIININGVEYKTAIIFNYIPSIPERNCGMFWEPGIFATYLSISLIFELIFKKRKTSFFRIIIFSLGIITANSSAGFALLPLCLLLLLTKKRKNKNLSLFFNLLTVILIFVIIFAFFNLESLLQNSPLANNEYVQKLLLENMESQSRVQALEHNMNIFFDFPIFGAGISYVSDHMQFVADTSTTTYLLSAFGILGSLYTIFWAYGIFRQKNLNFLTKLLIFVIIIFIINKEPHSQILFTWCLLFYFLKSNTLKEGERNLI